MTEKNNIMHRLGLRKSMRLQGRAIPASRNLPARNGDSPLKYYLQSCRFSKFHVFYLGRSAEEFAASHCKELVCRVRYASGSIVLWE